MPKVIAENIPPQLQALDHWILWREEQRKGKPTKIPYQLNGQEAKVDDPSTWAAFDAVQAGYDPAKYSGLGFVFTEEHKLFGIDLDSCLYADGTMTRWAEEVMRICPTYAEVSPSGTGIKLLGIGEIPSLPAGKTGKTFTKDLEAANPNKSPEIAIWRSRRYFAITGRIHLAHDTINECHRVGELFDRLFKTTPKQPRPMAANRATHQADRIKLAVAAMCRADVPIRNDGSKRLYHCCCRCVGFDLSHADSFTAIRAYEQLEGSSVQWTDEKIGKTLDDAERDVRRGEDLRPTQSEPAYRDAGSRIKTEPKKFTTVDEIAATFVQGLDATTNKLYSTGIGELDSVLRGGLELGEIFILAARPSHGKTAVALQMLHSLSNQGLACLYVNEEMSHKALGKRTVSFVSPLHNDTWTHNKADITLDLKSHFKQRSSLYVVDCLQTVDNVAHEIRRFHCEHGVQVVAVDYLQRLTARGRDETERVTNASKVLSSLAKELGIMLLMLCQLNRSIEHRATREKAGRSEIPKMSDLRQSGQIEQDADVITFAVFPRMFNPEHKPSDQYIFSIAKNRERGINDSIAICSFNPERQTVLDPAVQDHKNYYAEFDEYR